MIRAILKFLAFAILCIMVVPVQTALLWFTKGPAAYVLPHIWQKSVCAIFQIKVIREGAPYKGTQTLFMSNHISYLDIPVIASLIQEASFVAKKDVASWPVWGYLSSLQQTAFISRGRGDAKQETNALDNMLSAGKNLTIFPEGTSTDGQNILPFKSSLFSIALREELQDLVVQPVTVKIIETDGSAPKTQDQRDIYAWHRDMDDDLTLDKHLWRFAKTKGVVIKVTFHAPMNARDYSDRKILAKACEKAVCSGLDIQNAA